MIKQLPNTWRFKVHYNKPKDKWSIHFRGKCHIVENLLCLVPIEGKKSNIQPRRIMQGFAKEVRILEDHAIIR